MTFYTVGKSYTRLRVKLVWLKKKETFFASIFIITKIILNSKKKCDKKLIITKYIKIFLEKIFSLIKF